jgi:4-hydroxyphenylpyruvate dioxygenase
MNVAVLEANTFKIVFIEPLDGKKKSQIQEFLDFHSGPGVTHAALTSNNIIDSISKFKSSGIEFVSVLDDYYEKWKLKSEFKRIKEDWKDLEKLRILIDGYYEENLFKYLLQTFTTPLSDRPTFYLEVIQRNMADGFGKGNISALYEAIENLQEKRGNSQIE